MPLNPPEWELPCVSNNNRGNQDGSFIKCNGSDPNGFPRSIFLLGDSHAVPLAFPLRDVAKGNGMDLFYPNRSLSTDYGAYPYSFLETQVVSDELIEYVLNHSNPGDYFITTLHRGRLNPSRDSHISIDVDLAGQSARAETFEANMMHFLPMLGKAGLRVYLVKDPPLLPNAMKSISECMYQFSERLASSCAIDLEQDLHTRAQLDEVFDKLDAAFSFVQAVDPARDLFHENVFTPIDSNGQYRMIDKHHLSEYGAMELTPFFNRIVKPTSNDG